MVDTRIADGSFTTLFEFCERIDLRAVNRRVVESLIAAGALDSLEGHRAQKMEALELAFKAASKAQEDREKGQISLFDSGGSSELVVQDLPEAEEWSEREKLAKERDLLGFYLSSHPLKSYARDLKNFARPLSEIEGQRNGAPLRVGGLSRGGCASSSTAAAIPLPLSRSKTSTPRAISRFSPKPSPTTNSYS